MTLPARNSRRVISGSGWSNPLTHAFPLENATYLEVWADDVQLVLGVDYSISGIGDDAGYSVTITEPGDWTPEAWVLNVVYPIDQPSDVDQGGEFGKRFEDALDRLTLGLQTLDDRTKRTPKVAITTDTGIDVSMDAPVSGSVIGWDATGTRLENKGTVPNIDVVAQYITDIVTVSVNIGAVNVVATDMASVLIAAANIGNVNAVGGSIGNVNTVAGALMPVGVVATNIASVNAVAPGISAVVAVAPHIDDVVTITPDIADVSTVADEIAAVVNTSANMSAVINAPAYAALAEKWATEAEDTPVIPGLYSAFHWAQKAANAVIGGLAAAIHGATDKAAPAGNDEIAITDSAASWGLKKLTLTNLAAWLADLSQTLTNKTLTAPTITLKQSAGPTPTTEGDIQWDTDDNCLVIGDGTGQKTFSDDSKVLPLTGGTMTGKIKLDGDPSDALHAATKQYVDGQPGVAKAWVNFNGTGTVAIRDSHNVSSITDNGVGNYTVHFATALPNSDYVAVGSHSSTVEGFATLEISRSTTAFRFSPKTPGVGASDVISSNVAIFGG